MKAIDSVRIEDMAESSPEELLREFADKNAQSRLGPMTLIGSGLLAIPALASPPVLVGWIAIAAVLTAFAYLKDDARKSVVLFYELEPEIEQAYRLVHDWAEHLAGAGKVWHVAAKGDVTDGKYHAGASHVVQRQAIQVDNQLPRYVKSNVAPVRIPVGEQTLYLFPDRALLMARSGVAAVAYPELELEPGTTNFVEEAGVPSDAKVVGRTWRYVNKKGGPDRRFANNPELPICEYETVWFRSPSGLNELLHVSRPGAVEGLANAIRHLAGMIRNANAAVAEAG